MSGLDFELNTAEIKLSEIKQEAENYLTEFWYKRFENAIGNMARKECPNFDFGTGGELGWYSEVFEILSRWIVAEEEYCKLLGKKVESYG